MKKLKKLSKNLLQSIALNQILKILKSFTNYWAFVGIIYLYSVDKLWILEKKK